MVDIVGAYHIKRVVWSHSHGSVVKIKRVTVARGQDCFTSRLPVKALCPNDCSNVHTFTVRCLYVSDFYQIG